MPRKKVDRRVITVGACYMCPYMVKGYTENMNGYRLLCYQLSSSNPKKPVAIKPKNGSKIDPRCPLQKKHDIVKEALGKFWDDGVRADSIEPGGVVVVPLSKITKAQMEL